MTFGLVKLIFFAPCLNTDLVYPASKNNTQTPGGLGLVCASGMYRFNGHVEVPKVQTGILV